MKKILYSIAIIALIITGAIAIIGYGRGYRFNFGEKVIDSTGILSATSSPDGASIWIDGKLKSATNGSFAIEPGWYNLKITKDGYQAWEKKIKIQGEVVSRIDALLIPNNPSLRALTVSGVLTPVLSPSGTRVAYIVPEEETARPLPANTRTGIWIYELRNGPLGGQLDPKQVYVPTQNFDWKNAQILWSPDEKQLILEIKNKEKKVLWAQEIFLDNPNTPPLIVTATIDVILADWDNLKREKQNQSLSSLPQPLSDFLTTSTNNIEFSPDNNKIFYLATTSATLAPIITPPLIGTNATTETRIIAAGRYYVFDLKEDKNFYILDAKSIKDSPTPIWYPDSKRILMIENASINIIDYDGTNKKVVYSGPFAENVVYPWTTAGKLVILTNLNKPKALPNLYEVDIR